MTVLTDNYVKKYAIEDTHARCLECDTTFESNLTVLVPCPRCHPHAYRDMRALILEGSPYRINPFNFDIPGTPYDRERTTRCAMQCLYCGDSEHRTTREILQYASCRQKAARALNRLRPFVPRAERLSRNCPSPMAGRTTETVALARRFYPPVETIDDTPSGAGRACNEFEDHMRAINKRYMKRDLVPLLSDRGEPDYVRFSDDFDTAPAEDAYNSLVRERDERRAYNREHGTTGGFKHRMVTQAPLPWPCLTCGATLHASIQTVRNLPIMKPYKTPLAVPPAVCRTCRRRDKRLEA